jgi:hypothetical protein
MSLYQSRVARNDLQKQETEGVFSLCYGFSL